MGRATWLVDVLRGAGLDVVTVDGWQTRGGGDLDPRVIVNHHTAARSRTDAPSLLVVVKGRKDLKGPLCNVLVARSGRVYVVAAGTTSNAGLGLWRPAGAWRNRHTIGVECENDGIGEPWDPRCYAATVAINAAICAHLGWGEDRCIGHREWTPRKIDPTFDLDEFRRHVRDNTPGDDMTPEQSRQLAELHAAMFRGSPNPAAEDYRSPILTTHHLAHLIAAAHHQGTDAEAIADAVLEQMGEHLAAELVSALGRKLAGG